MRRFLVTAAERGGTVRLRGAELRHLRTVLRLRPGDRVELFDGKGRSFAAEIRTIGRDGADLEVLEELARVAEPSLSLTLAVAVSKGAKLDWVVEKATELGVGSIVPFVSERTVVDAQAVGRRAERWRRIAESAAAQCRRAGVPTIADVSAFADVLALASEHDLSILYWEDAPGGSRPLPERVRRVLAVTGPEGGFTAAEARAAERAGFLLARLGPRVLRAETAAIVAAALCQSRWGDLR